ncbi:hypothetical protein H5410_003918, partial [Solanum commersonii]
LKTPLQLSYLKLYPQSFVGNSRELVCSNKFEVVKPSFFRTKTNITYTLLQVTQKNFGQAKIGESWNSLCQIFETYINQRTSIRVKWLKPPRNFIKLNSDGSLGKGTSNMAEACALLYGLKCCVSRGYDRVWGERIPYS